MKQEFINLDAIEKQIIESIHNENFGELKAVVYLYERTLRHIGYKYSSFSEMENKLLNLHLDQIEGFYEMIVKYVLPEQLSKKDFRTAKDLQETLETIGKINSSLSSNVKKRVIVEKGSYEKAEALLEASIKSGMLISLYDENIDRAIGKTTALINKAYDLNCGLIVANNTQADVARNMADEWGMNINVFTSTREASMTQFKHIKSFLVDEGVSDETINDFNKKGYKILGGFKRLPNSKKLDCDLF